MVWLPGLNVCLTCFVCVWPTSNFVSRLLDVISKTPESHITNSESEHECKAREDVTKVLQERNSSIHFAR